jgi:hypothetical protein
MTLIVSGVVGVRQSRLRAVCSSALFEDLPSKRMPNFQAGTVLGIIS